MTAEWIPLECEECEKPLDPKEAVWALGADFSHPTAEGAGLSIPLYREVPAGTDGAVPYHRACLEARRKRQSPQSTESSED
jgi:hypothetical protein